MPVNVIVGLVSLLFALILYSVGTWSAFRRKGFGVSQVAALWLGFAFDVIATVSMAWRIGGLDFSTPPRHPSHEPRASGHGGNGDQCGGRHLCLVNAGQSAGHQNGSFHPGAVGTMARDVPVGTVREAVGPRHDGNCYHDARMF